VLDDPATFVEANLAQMLAYAAFTGVTDGWLPAEYAETAGSLLVSARDRLDSDGLITGVCGAPHFDRPGVSAEAQAFFLLASRAAQRHSEAAQRSGTAARRHGGTAKPPSRNSRREPAQPG
jgi:unsaturated rhamnogalacturonyl hydrolase